MPVGKALSSWLRSHSGVGASALVFTLAVGLAGCSATGATDYSSVELQKNITVLDYDYETITYPTSEFSLSTAERRTVDYAIDLLIADCVRDKGQDVEVIDRRGLGAEGTRDRSMGIWSLEYASKWGYGSAPPSDLMRKLLDMNAGLPPGVQEAWSACMETVDEKNQLDLAAVTGQNDLTSRAQSEAWDMAAGRDEWTSALDDWSGCIRKSGLTPNPNQAGLVQGGEKLPQRQQINAAIADVKCKNSVDLVQRLADIRASFELEFIDVNKAALVAQRDKIDELLSKAEEVIDEYGGAG